MTSSADDILIVGAGPAGAAAALVLGRAGIPCILADKAQFPRDKVCGDAISGKVVSTLNRIDPAIMERFRGERAQIGSWGVSFVAPNGKALRVPFRQSYDAGVDEAPGFISKRLDFDNFLLQEALGYPTVDFRPGTDIQKAVFSAGRWEVSAGNGTVFQPRMLLVANGAQSFLPRQLAALHKENGHYCAGIRTYWQGVTGMEADNFIELHFVKDFLPGYLWIFPLPNGMANVGVGMRSDKVAAKKVNLKQEMLRILEQMPPFRERFRHAQMVDGPKGYGLPLGSKQRRISGDGFLLLGDAASLIDPFTGEGIGNAIISGKVAAETVIATMTSGALTTDKLQRYDKEVYRKLWNELLLSYRMQQLVNYPWLFNLVVNKALRNKTLQETISCMFEDLDMRKRLKQPSFYWKLLVNG